LRTTIFGFSTQTTRTSPTSPRKLVNEWGEDESAPLHWRLGGSFVAVLRNHAEIRGKNDDRDLCERNGPQAVTGSCKPFMRTTMHVK
jgi:hypothetical protein